MTREIEQARGISVILPAFNEARQIFQMIAEVHAVVSGLGRAFEIIAVDDGSTDDTAVEIRRAASEFDHVHPIILSKNQGKGNALNRGFQASRMELVCFIDADLDLHPRQVKNLLEEMDRTGADIVIGSKRHPESRLDYPWYRKLFSTVYYLLVLLLFHLPVKDTQTGLKLFRREALARSFPRMVGKKYTLDLELLLIANKLGYRIAEAPVDLTYQGKFGCVGWPSIRNILTDTLAVYYRLHILRYYNSEMLPTVLEEPRVSIVMTATKLDSSFDRFLQGCLDLNYRNFDIKVVTDGPVDAGVSDERLSFIQGGSGGSAAKKNIAARQCADADVLAFIDQDAVPDIDWLKNAAPYFDDDSMAAVCGPAIVPAEGSRKQLAGGLVFSSFMVSGTTSYRYTRHAMREVDDYPSFNFIVRRSDFLDAGGYPEALAPGEDTVLCLRLTKDMGKKILYVPNLLVFQPRDPLFLPYLRKVYLYAHNRGRFVRRFPETSRRLQYFLPSVLLMAWILGLGLSFVSSEVLYVYLSAVAGYVLLAMLASVKSLDVPTNLMIMVGIIATNIVYGVGFATGLASRNIERFDLAESGSE